MTTVFPPATLDHGAPGRLERLPDIATHLVRLRPVDVWLPDGFRPDQRHHVLVMHDGQMVFEAKHTWNQQAWQVHCAVQSLINSGRIPPTLVVAVWNDSQERMAEYFPEQALAWLADETRAHYLQEHCNGQAKGRAYLRFVVEEVLPAVQGRFGTASGAAHTTVMGSSMGGLASLAALCDYPRVFGAAGALSAHWPGLSPKNGLDSIRNAALPLALLQYLLARLPSPGSHKLWLDRGDDTLDQLYAPGLTMAAEVLHSRGYSASQAVVRTVPGTGHNERDWSLRVAEVLSFLLAR